MDLHNEAPLLGSFGTIGAFVHPPENRFAAYWGFRGETDKMRQLKEYFNKLNEGLDEAVRPNLWNRFEQSIFGRFIDIYNRFHYKGVIFGHLYFALVHPDNNEEIHFRFGEKTCKFRRREFGMVMGLRFGQAPNDARKESMCLSSPCPLSLCDRVTVRKLEDALEKTRDPEIMYRLGLVYFLYGILMGIDEKTTISKDIFYVVEDLQLVETYPWGEYVWNNLMWNICKIVDKYKVSTPKDRCLRPTAEGCLMSLQYWAFDTLPRLITDGGGYADVDPQRPTVPRMMKWRCRKGGAHFKSWEKRIKAETLVVTYLLASDEEVEFLRGLGLTDAEINSPPHDFHVPPVIEAAHAHPPPVVEQGEERHPQIRRVDGVDAATSVRVAPSTNPSSSQRMQATSTSANPSTSQHMHDLHNFEDKLDAIAKKIDDQYTVIVAQKQLFVEHGNLIISQGQSIHDFGVSVVEHGMIVKNQSRVIEKQSKIVNALLSQSGLLKKHSLSGDGNLPQGPRLDPDSFGRRTGGTSVGPTLFSGQQTGTTGGKHAGAIRSSQPPQSGQQQRTVSHAFTTPPPSVSATEARDTTTRHTLTPQVSSAERGETTGNESQLNYGDQFIVDPE